jgi:Flp pilus assembly protein TadG
MAFGATRLIRNAAPVTRSELMVRRGMAALRAVTSSDRGSSAVELAVLAPAFLMVIMLIIQFGLWFNARQVALAAAQAGARVARAEAGVNTLNWQRDATTTASNYFRGLNTHLLGTVTAMPVTGTQQGTPVVGITVSGPLGYSVFGWFGATWTVTQTVTGPVECFHPAANGGGC